MRKKIAVIVLTAAFAALFAAGCGGSPSGGSDSGSGSASSSVENLSGAASSVESSSGTDSSGKIQGNGMEGVWYQQDLNGNKIIIHGKTIRYESGYSDYTEESEFTVKDNGGKITILPKEELFAVLEIEYDSENDVLTARDWPHTDGDGGYHLLVYQRNRFTPTPEPTYGPRADKSDPDAPKTVDSYAFTELHMSFYDEGDTSYIGTDMAMQPPYADYYDYDLTVSDDGSAELASGFCRAITVDADLVEELTALMEKNDLASINGLDIHTEDIPYDAPGYEFSLTLASGETLHSSADYKDVPENWSAFQQAAHTLLFDAFEKAGYNAGTGEFHTTEPMKRIGREEQKEMGVTRGEEKLTRSDLSYDYDVYAKYTTFEFSNETPEGLARALQAYSEGLREASEKDLQNDFELMEGASKAEIQKAARLYAYSFRSVEYMYGDDLLYYVFESEGHANSLGIGYSAHGVYPYHRYAYDTQTGERVYAADLFIDEDAALTAVTEAFCRRYSREEMKSVIQSKEIQDKIRKSLKGEDGAGPMDFSWRYDRIDFYMPEDIMDNDGYAMTCWIYYEDIQDILSDRYTTVR